MNTRILPLIQICKSIEEFKFLLPPGLLLKIQETLNDDEKSDSLELEKKRNESIKKFFSRAAPEISQNLSECINSIATQITTTHPAHLAINEGNFKVIRRNGEPIADYIKRIQQTVAEVEKIQTNIEDLIFDLRLYFEYFCEALDGEENIPKLFKTDLGDNYLSFQENLVELFNEHEEIIANLQAQAREELLNLNPIKDNTIVVFIWYLKGVEQGANQILGFDSTGHIGIALKKKDEPLVYISFYPRKKNEAPSFLGRLAKKLGMPSPDPVEGFCEKFEEDLARRYLDNNKMSYWKSEQIELECANGSSLDLNSAIEEAKKVLNTKLTYDYYDENCAKMGYQILAAAKCASILPPPTEIVSSPYQVFTYAKDVKELQEIELKTTSLAQNDVFQKRILKRLAFVKSKIEQTRLNAQRNHGYFQNKTAEDKQYADLFLKDVIREIEKLEKEISQTKNLKELYKKLNKQHIINFPALINNYKASPFIETFFNEQIKPLLTPLKVFLTTDAQQKIQQIVNQLQNNFKIITENMAKQKEFASYILIQKNIFTLLTELVNNSLSENPRQIALMIADKFHKMKSQISYVVTKNKEFKKEYISLLETSLGILNQYLYFDAYCVYTDEDKDSLMHRLQDLLLPGVKEAPTDVSLLLEKAMQTFQKNNTPASQAIYAVLQAAFKEGNEIEDDQHLKLHLQRIIYKELSRTLSISKRRELDELHYQAIMVATVKAFIYGKLTKDEFESALDKAAKITHSPNKRLMTDRFLDTFCFQAYLDDVEPPKQHFQNIKKYNYHNDETGNVISTDNADEFFNQLPVPFNQAMSQDSSYRFIMEAMQTLFSDPLFTLAMRGKNITTADFKHAIGNRFNKEGKDQANMKLAKIYADIKKKAVDMCSDGEKLFHDVYQYIEVLTDIFKHPEYTKEQRNKVNSIQTLTCHTDTLGDKFNVFVNCVKSAVNVSQIENEVILEKIATSCNHLARINQQIAEKTKTKFINNYYQNKKDEAENDLFTKDLADGFILNDLTADIDNPEDETKAIGEINENLRSLYTLMCSRKALEIIQNRLRRHDSNKELPTIHKILKKQLEKIKNIQVEHPTVNDKKFNKQEMDGPQNQAQLTPVIAEAKKQIEPEIIKTLGMVNSLMYLEQPQCKRLIADFLNISNSEYKSIDRILNEALAYQPQDYTKEFVKIIRDFAKGKNDETTFYHQLSSFIEDHRPRFLIPGFNWIYKIFFNENVAHKYSMMPTLIDLKKQFANQFSSLKVNQTKNPNFELIYKDADAPQKEKGGTRLQNKIAAKIHGLFAKRNKKLSQEQIIKNNLKYAHYTQRVKELGQLDKKLK